MKVINSYGKLFCKNPLLEKISKSSATWLWVQFIKKTWSFWKKSKIL